MAKFIKSIFHPTDTQNNISREGEAEDEKSEDPSLNSRRNLSISRSGRLKQANKKRHSLTLDLYGENDIQSVEKPKSMEYNVQSPANQSSTESNFDNNQRRCSADEETTTDFDPRILKPKIDKSLDDSILSEGAKSPEEEIDSAFEIIDKS